MTVLPRHAPECPGGKYDRALARLVLVGEPRKGSAPRGWRLAMNGLLAARRRWQTNTTITCGRCGWLRAGLEAERELTRFSPKGRRLSA